MPTVPASELTLEDIPMTHPQPAVNSNRLQLVIDPSETAELSLVTDSDDLLMFCTPVLGPTATLLAHRLARMAHPTDAVAWRVGDLAGSLGVSETKLFQALNRLERYGVAKWVGVDTVMLRTRLPQLSVRMAAKYPHYLLEALLQRMRAAKRIATDH